MAEIQGNHAMSYVLPIFWTKNIFGIDNPLILRQIGSVGKMSSPSFGNFHAGDAYHSRQKTRQRLLVVAINVNAY